MVSTGARQVEGWRRRGVEPTRRLVVRLGDVVLVGRQVRHVGGQRGGVGGLLTLCHAAGTPVPALVLATSLIIVSRGVVQLLGRLELRAAGASVGRDDDGGRELGEGGGHAHVLVHVVHGVHVAAVEVRALAWRGHGGAVLVLPELGEVGTGVGGGRQGAGVTPSSHRRLHLAHLAG